MNSERIQTLEQWIKEDPNDPFNKYGLAMELIKQQPEKAAILFDQLLIQHPEYLPTYYIAAQFFSQSKPAKAIDILETGIELAKKQSNEKARREMQSALDELNF